MSFATEAEAMFQAFDERVEEVRQDFIIETARWNLRLTPGPGNQHPPETDYVATGRLRAGWSFTLATPPTEADRRDGGPYDESFDGEETAAQIAETVRLEPFAPISYLTNDVGYGYVVHEGLDKHAGRPDQKWTLETPYLAEEFLIAAENNGGR